jgi:hypothetical protein
MIKERDFSTRYGASIEIPRLLPQLALYVEYARRDDRRAGDPVIGNAVYAAATAYAGPSVWLLEFQSYDNFDPVRATVLDTRSPVASALLYQQAPTLERVQTQFTTNSNITGSRLRVDLTVKPWLILSGSVRYGALKESADEHTLVDSWVGAQLRWNQGLSQFFPLVGFRWERNDTSGSLYERLVAIEWTAVQALPHRLALESQAMIWLRDKPVPADTYHPWEEGQVYLALKWAPRLIAALGYEFNTSLSEEHGFTRSAKLPVGHYFNGSVQWNITPDTSVRLFAGGQRAGLKCISGVCRIFPPFEGVKLDVVIRL